MSSFLPTRRLSTRIRLRLRANSLPKRCTASLRSFSRYSRASPRNSPLTYCCSSLMNFWKPTARDPLSRFRMSERIVRAKCSVWCSPLLIHRKSPKRAPNRSKPMCSLVSRSQRKTRKRANLPLNRKLNRPSPRLSARRRPQPAPSPAWQNSSATGSMQRNRILLPKRC